VTVEEGVGWGGKGMMRLDEVVVNDMAAWSVVVVLEFHCDDGTRDETMRVALSLYTHSHPVAGRRRPVGRRCFIQSTLFQTDGCVVSRIGDLSARRPHVAGPTTIQSRDYTKHSADYSLGRDTRRGCCERQTSSRPPKSITRSLVSEIHLDTGYISILFAGSQRGGQ
jgi:hypothetical protein